MNTDFNPNEKDEDGETILMCVASTGRLDLVKFLVEKGADVNLSDYDEISFPLNEAARFGWQEVYDYLLPLTSSELRQIAEANLSEGIKYRQEQNIKLSENFVKYAWHGEIDKLKASIENGIDINVLVEMPGSSGESALHRACQFGRKSIVNLLIETGANINIQEQSRGITPLIKSIQARNAEIVKILLDAGANIKIKDFSGKDALDYAQQINDKEILELLLKVEEK
jgi:ankyrin repeat protein